MSDTMDFMAKGRRKQLHSILLVSILPTSFSLLKVRSSWTMQEVRVIPQVVPSLRDTNG